MNINMYVCRFACRSMKTKSLYEPAILISSYPSPLPLPPSRFHMWAAGQAKGNSSYNAN